MGINTCDMRYMEDNTHQPVGPAVNGTVKGELGYLYSHTKWGGSWSYEWVFLTTW